MGSSEVHEITALETPVPGKETSLDLSGVAVRDDRLGLDREELGGFSGGQEVRGG
jgi:hypothetical protein